MLTYTNGHTKTHTRRTNTHTLQTHTHTPDTQTQGTLHSSDLTHKISYTTKRNISAVTKMCYWNRPVKHFTLFCLFPCLLCIDLYLSITFVQLRSEEHNV